MKKYVGAAAIMVALAAIGMGPRFAGAPRASAAGESKKNISPEAERVLRRMTSYLGSLQSFRVQSVAKDEVVLKSGQKIDLPSLSHTSVQRPNKLHSEQVGSRGGLAFYYDGKSMTLSCAGGGTYVTRAAPPTIDGTIDKARRDFQSEAPGADLLFSKPYDVLTEQVTSGVVVGQETVDGLPVTHLAFTGEEVDWQIWIKDGSEPLPVWFSIISKTVPSQPEFEVHLSHWETRVSIPPSEFTFTASADAKKVDSAKACTPTTTAQR